MEGKGIVKQVDKHKIIISSYKKMSCDKCKSCTEGGKIQKECEFRLKKKFEVQKGDIVTFTVRDKRVLQYSFLIYIFPLLGFFLGNYIVRIAFEESSESLQIIGSFLGMGLSFILVYFADKRLGETILENIEVIKKKKRD